jgi:uncharacterized protein (TIGR02466 family)
MGLDFLYGIGATFTMNFETIFTNFIAYEQIQLDNDSIEQYCHDKRKENDKGRVLSNVGGWQSGDQFTKDADHVEMVKLIDIINDKFQMLGSNLEFNNPDRITIDNFWININKKTNANKLHDHPKSIIVAVYYVKVPDNSGNIILRTPVVSYDKYIKPENIGRYNTFNSSTYTYTPKVGDLVIFPAWLQHRVEPNQTNEERISIAFNGSFR